MNEDAKNELYEKMNELSKLIDHSHNIVFFGGAGVSTESKIPDFRSSSGLYRSHLDRGYPPETILSHRFFMQHTDVFYSFYKEKMIHENAVPNAAHIALAKLEAKGKLKAVITQNIDGLHQLAGSKKVYELHGSVHRNFCMDCGKFYGLEKIIHSDLIPRCDDCGGTIKPDVVLYEENLNSDVLEASIRAIELCDLFIVGGTSLAVYPAASLLNYYKSTKLILINKSKTTQDHRARIQINASIGEVLSRCV